MGVKLGFSCHCTTLDELKQTRHWCPPFINYTGIWRGRTVGFIGSFDQKLDEFLCSCWIFPSRWNSHGLTFHSGLVELWTESTDGDGCILDMASSHASCVVRRQSRFPSGFFIFPFDCRWHQSSSETFHWFARFMLFSTYKAFIYINCVFYNQSQGHVKLRSPCWVVLNHHDAHLDLLNFHISHVWMRTGSIGSQRTRISQWLIAMIVLDQLNYMNIIWKYSPVTGPHI